MRKTTFDTFAKITEILNTAETVQSAFKQLKYEINLSVYST